jgi:hypothetical protein
MARTIDRQFVSEAVRLSGKWTYLSRTPSVILGKGPSFDERLVIRYGSVGQIVEADHNFPGIRNELNREGIPVPLSQAGEIATEICQARHDGQTTRQLIAKGISSGLTANQAAIEVVGAEFHFCPAYSNDL